MLKTRQKIDSFQDSAMPQPINALAFPVTAHITKSDNPGLIMVQYNENKPKSARLISGIDRRVLTQKENIGREILVVFDGGNPDLPIIIGVMESIIDDLVSMEINGPENPDKKPIEIKVDGKRIEFEAEEEIVLKCGNGSISIKKEGKIIVKGTEIISRASGNNKIKGGSVELN